MQMLIGEVVISRNILQGDLMQLEVKGGIFGQTLVKSQSFYAEYTG